jgi:aconitate hydratase
MNTPQTFTTGSGSAGKFYSLPALEAAGIGKVSKLPVSIRIVLESLLRNLDGKKVTEADVKNLANWNAKAPGEYEIPFTVARIVLQDFTGVPLLVDLAAMRSKVKHARQEPEDGRAAGARRSRGGPLGAGRFRRHAALAESKPRAGVSAQPERYQFLKWGEQAFDTFKVVPPGIGIVHQVNLEYLAKGVLEKDGVYYPDSLVGTDSHTTMINGLGVVGWGVGGIEAEAGMLGQPVTFLVPEVVGVYLTGALKEGVTATDLVLEVTEVLRKLGVVGKFVEFYGPGAVSLSVPTVRPSRTWPPSMARRWASSASTKKPSPTCAARAAARSFARPSRTTTRRRACGASPPRRAASNSPPRSRSTSAASCPASSGPKRPQDRIEVPALKTSSATKPAPMARM